MVERRTGKAFGDVNGGQVCDPKPVEAMNFDPPGDERTDRVAVINVGRVDKTPPSARIQVVLLHGPLRFPRVDDHVPVAEVGIAAAMAVAFELGGDRPNFLDDRHVNGFGTGIGIEAEPCEARQLLCRIDRPRGRHSLI